jgi:hypothetical protein
MVRHILTYASGGNDKTAVAITKISDSGTDIIKEIIYTGTNEGAVILEDLTECSLPFEELKELKILRATRNQRNKRTIRKIKRALGLTPSGWLKDFIFYVKHHIK